MLEATSDFVGMAKAETGELVYMNKAGRKMVGLLEDEDISSTKILDYHPKWANRLLSEQGLPTAADKGLWRGEGAFLHRDGTEIPTSMVVLSHKDTSGKVQFYSTISRDITDRKQAEDELRQSNERFRLVLKAAPIALFTQDRDLRFTWVYNPTPGFEPDIDAFIGKTDSEIVSPHQAMAPMALKRRVLETGKPAREEISFSTNGNTTWFDLHIEPHRDASGEVIGITCISIDITEKKQLEERLLQSQKMDAIGRLAGGVAHDFNNMLQVINGYCQVLLRRDDLNQPVQNLVGEIEKSGYRAASLTRQLLAFGRKQVLQPRVFDLNAVVGQLHELLHRTLGEDVVLESQLGSNLWNLKADVNQIEQTIVNLAINAREAMPNGGSLTIATTNVAVRPDGASRFEGIARGDYVMLAVTDTGRGMDDETKSKIFEPFFTTKERGKGTGLGLSTVHGIVKQSDGYIFVESKLGKGATFKIYLPRSEEAIQIEEEAALSAAKVDGRATILVVEDEPLVRKAVSSFLTTSQFEVMEAVDGEDALEIVKLHKGHCDAVLTDVIMRGMNGPELAKRLAQEYPKINVIYMSGHTENELERQGMLIPGTIFLQKPFDPDELLHTLNKVLSSAK